MKIKILPTPYLILLVLILSTSFTCFAQKRSLKAEIRGSSDKKVYLFVRDPNNRVKLIDSTVSVNDKFAFTQNLKEPAFYTISVDKIPGGLMFVWDDNLKIKGDSKTLIQSQVKGSRLTDEWIKYDKAFITPVRTQIIAQSNELRNASLDPVKRKELVEQQRELLKHLNLQADEYIAEHPHSFISLFLLNGRWQELGEEKTKQVLKRLSSGLQSHSIAMAMEENFKAMQEEAKRRALAEAGNLAPDFKVQDLNGKEISLEKLKGQYVLLDFWGSWCGPCIQLIPETKNAFQRYKDKNVQFLGIAFEEEKDRTKLNKLIEKHELSWPQIFQDLSDKNKSQVIHKYAVSEYPSVILINPAGKIIYRGTGQTGLAEACKVLDKEI